MAQCLNCGEVIEGSTQKKFCNDKCRKAYSRKLGQAEKEKSDILQKLTAQELYNAIDHYQANNWVESPEYLELVRRLQSMPVEGLRKAGYYIPAWKEHGLKCPL